MVVQLVPVGVAILEGVGVAGGATAGGAAAGGGAAAAGSTGLIAAVGMVFAAIGLTGDVDVEQARKRQEEAEKAKTTPIARSESVADGVRKCTECPPRCGTVYVRNTNGWSETSIAYQSRISGFPAGNGSIPEWNFNGVKFDGFDPGPCLLKESKAKYDQFFDEYGALEPWWKGKQGIINEACSQSNVSKPQPPIQLRWYFMQPISYKYFTKLFSRMALSIVTVHQP